MTFSFIEGHLKSSFPGFECSGVILKLGGVNGSLDGVVKCSVVDEEAYCGFNAVTKVIDLDEKECTIKDRALEKS